MQLTEQIPNDPPRIGAKSTTTSNQLTTPPPLNVDVKIIEGAGVVHRLDPRKAHTLGKTFHDYCEYLLLPYIENMLQSVNRLDIVYIFPIIFA